MQSKRSFTKAEAAIIRELLRKKVKATPSAQKCIRDRIRDLGFFISEFATDEGGFRAVDFNALVEQGLLRIEEKTSP